MSAPKSSNGDHAKKSEPAKIPREKEKGEWVWQCEICAAIVDEHAQRCPKCGIIFIAPNL